MEVAHFAFNIIFFCFAYISIKILMKVEEKQSKFKKNLMMICFICGVLIYFLYLALIISSIREGVLYEDSLVVLITSWACMFAVERISNKHK